MQNRKNILEKAFLGVSALGALYVLTEIILQQFGESICFGEGCKVVAEYARFGELSILLIGFLTLFLLTALAILSRYFNRTGAEKYINLILIVSLACEGFFTGYQAFRINEACVFCLSFLGILIVLGMLRLLSGEKEMIAGFAAMAAVFSLLYLVLPAGGTVSIPEGERLILFYSPDCKHCGEIMKELEKRSIAVSHQLVGKYSRFLKNIGIEHVPTLLVNGKYEKIFLTGNEAIRAYLSCIDKRKVSSHKPGAGVISKTRKSAKPENTEAVQSMDIFDARDKSMQIFGPSIEEDMCKEDEKCD